MARKPKISTTGPVAPGKASIKDTQADDTSKPFTVEGLDSVELVEILDEQIGESEKFWNGAPYNLEEVSKQNEALYLGTDVDDDNPDAAKDNRIFSAIRTIVPHVTTRITEPDIYPSSGTQAAKKFGEDMERALHIHADDEEVKAKMKFALEDAIIKRRGYLKPRYDPVTGNFCAVDYIPCESIIMDHKSRPYEEPRYFRHVLDKTVDDLLLMFPEQEKKIKEAFGITERSTKRDYLKSYKVNEDWKFIVVDGKLDLVVCWHYKKTPFGVIKDPNWRYDQANFMRGHMMPIVSVNVLSDGRTYIDKTSYVEQAKYSQRTIDKREEQISQNAGLGSVGMPVVDKEALGENEAEYLTYEQDTVLSLKIPDNKNINDVFTKWQAAPLSGDVYKSKVDAVEAVSNAFGASAVNQGSESNNKTLGQDELLRDESQGRQQDIVDAIDTATKRLYKLMAQMLLVYGNEQEIFISNGENSEFDYIVMHTETLDTMAQIRVKAGTSMPVDKAQRRATADKASTQGMIDPLSYWEIMDQPNAQKYAKRKVDYDADPAAFLRDVNEELFDRNAYVDLELIKLGQVPPYRDELDKQYFDYLNKIALSGFQDNPNMEDETKAAMVAFINQQLARGSAMLGLAETQLPTAQDVAVHNQAVDEQNAAAPPEAPAAPGQPASAPGKAAKPQPTPVQPAI